MTILKTLSTGNGLVNAHRIAKAEIVGLSLHLQVHMYPSPEDAANDLNLRWQEYPVLPLAVLDVADPWGSMERGLVAQADGLLSGGTYVLDPVAGDLETAKALKWSEIKAERDQLECGGFDLAGVGRFDSDEESRNKIIGASLAAKIARDAGQTYAIAWTLADNTVAQLDADAIIGAGFAMLAHLDGIHQRSRALYAQIQSAETAEAVAAITWIEPEPEQPAEVPAEA
nr:DUF4376 domain-containing protein [Comamonas thiooxydans]